jgi:tellurite resistance protein
MMDWKKIKEKASELYEESARKIKQYTPESFSKEKKFVNSLVISLVLMTMADKKAQTEEIIASMDLINEIDEIQDLKLTQEAIELYELHLENLMEITNNDTKWTLSVAKLLSEVAKVKQYPEYPPMVENLLNYISESDGETCELETQMKEKILKALS